ncbi:MAG: TonB-dependent receptor, partial [Parvularculaceae bacterium]|nr:TonB-dependent receptor [Parvularculaceae bacterium]
MAAGSKPTSLRKILLSATMIATSAIVVTPAFAQEGGQETAAVSDEIVVTAERRATSLQQTPLSIKAFNDEMLAEKNISNVEDLANFVPGLSVGGETDGGSVRPIFIIRGIGQSSGRDTIERGVGLYVDDIFLPRATGSLLQLIDVERVEVLRGPQGTLFGRNSTGGAIRYITRKPERDEFTGRV